MVNKCYYFHVGIVWAQAIGPSKIPAFKIGLIFITVHSNFILSEWALFLSSDQSVPVFFRSSLWPTSQTQKPLFLKFSYFSVVSSCVKYRHRQGLIISRKPV